MFKKLLRAVIYLVVFIGSMFIFTGSGYASGMQVINREPVSIPAQLPMPAPKAYDPAKPTVAILLGTQSTETSDFLVPYEVFAASGAYNVFSVALERRLSTLGGGMDVLPDYSLAGLDQMLGKGPDLIVVPNIDESLPAINGSILDWLRHQAGQGSRLLSICVGARTLAEAGLLNGRQATTHWNYIDTAQKQFPSVQWQRGLRYVDDGSIVSSAGITSGIDASLHVVAQRLGLAAAERIANDLHYPDFTYVTNPRVEQYRSVASDSVFIFNLLYGLPRADAGVLLYNGAGEIDLTSIFDTYTASVRTITRSIAPTRDWITTKHGLRVLPRYDYQTAPAFARLLVPGQDARQLAQADVAAWTAQHNNVPIDFLHADLPGHFAFDAPLLDVARGRDIATAKGVAKTLEYRPPELALQGANWPWLLMVEPLMVGIGVVLLLFAGQRVLARRPLFGAPALQLQH